MKQSLFSFAEVKKIAAKASIPGLWESQPNKRWRLAVTTDAGLEWSPTRAKLLFYGPQREKEKLQAAVERVLQQDLIISPEDHAGLELEKVQAASDLMGCLIQHMQAGQKCEFPEPLVDYAVMLAHAFSTMDDYDGMPAFYMWSPPPCLGASFVQLTKARPTHPCSSLLMGWAGRMHDELSLGDLPTENALEITIEAAGLKNEFRWKRKAGKVRLMSRRSFEKQFGLRVRIELED